MHEEPRYARNKSQGLSFFIGEELVIPHVQSIAMFVIETTPGEYMYTKHGSYENVKKVFDRESALVEQFLGEKAYLLHFTDISDEMIEEINRVLQYTGYLNTFIKKYGLVNSETESHRQSTI